MAVVSGLWWEAFDGVAEEWLAIAVTWPLLVQDAKYTVGVVE